MLTCVTIDDEPLARECIADHIREVEFLKMVGYGSNPVDLMLLLDNHPVDLIFLDIHMPVINGIEFLKGAKGLPMVIITTAYPSYALDGFQLDVMDYLLKPITFPRFLHAVTKAKDYHRLSRVQQPPDTLLVQRQDYFFIKCDYKYERIYFEEILYIEAMQNYITIATTKGKFITLLSMKSVDQNLYGKAFIRIHKSYIVSVSRIDTVENDEVIIGSVRLPIGRNFREELINTVVNSNLWKK